VRYKFQDNKYSNLFSNGESFGIINNNNDNNSAFNFDKISINSNIKNFEVNPMMISLDQKFKDMENFDSNFFSNLAVRKFLLNFLLNFRMIWKKEVV